MSRELLAALRQIVGDAHVVTDPDIRAAFETDWTGRFGGTACAVVRPASTEQVAAVLRACGRHGADVVPQGGNTGLVGGGVPRGDEIVLSTTRLTAIDALDPSLGQITVQAGVTLGALQRRAAQAGLDAALDFAARDSATMGGIVACDAGGPRALRHGTARRRVLGLEAVVANGRVIRRMNGLIKDNAGLNLTSLIVGSEGTLAVITGVIWQLAPRLSERVAALITVPDVAAASALLTGFRKHAPSLEACEFMTEAGIELVLDHTGTTSPITAAPIYVLTELAARSDPTDELIQAIERADVVDVAVATDAKSRAQLWSLRELHPEAISRVGIPHKLDVGVPLARLEAFLDELPEAISACCPGARAIVFGHLADGNLHVNVVGPDPADLRADNAVLKLVLRLGGTISAEHGVGVVKAHALRAARGVDDFETIAAIKAALDPSSMLNPGVMLPIAGHR